ncbi:MAG TPA: fumarylacetoacetate hydrolase family protein [Bacillales bacterium]|nr:fumarylacetoacetate hydrolase family protein [Bacillales bacterium]
MKITRFVADGEKKTRTGVVTPVGIKEIEGDLFHDWTYTGEVFGDDVRRVAPLSPNQIIGIGANFVSQKEELPEELPEIPVFFYKSVASVIGPEEEIVIPGKLEEVKFESELAVVIGKEAYQVPESEVEEYIFGYTVGNDVTAPQYFREDGHWMVGKSFNTFTPLGPVIETDLDMDAIQIESYLNGTQKQGSSTSLMIVPIRKMISYLSRVMTLSPGDVILTGSPLGAEFLHDGDVIECTISEIGTLRNTAVKAKTKSHA